MKFLLMLQHNSFLDLSFQTCGTVSLVPLYVYVSYNDTETLDLNEHQKGKSNNRSRKFTVRIAPRH